MSRTPTFFINSVRHDGFFSLDGHLEAIEARPGGAIAAPSPPTDREAPAADVAADEVAEASWKSLPASDAPGWRDHA